ncbi:unnamed protein product [Strongylus vulgaris]|uniref:[F-actin]-monooxygenase MICAL1-3-like Rossman domain-containing protein n=1 Tax=Strongylus vulgaris TaxID=40348 RepID=A0A3P7KKQ3_STRVU|nr:unnamed protein product [Strongylus vulgaris]
MRGKLAIGITANFVNNKTYAEERVPEISGVAYIFNQAFFKEMYAKTGVDLENIVYYKDDTHYFVMCAKKQSLLDMGVILQTIEGIRLRPEVYIKNLFMLLSKVDNGLSQGQAKLMAVQGFLVNV